MKQLNKEFLLLCIRVKARIINLGAFYLPFISWYTISICCMLLLLIIFVNLDLHNGLGELRLLNAWGGWKNTHGVSDIDGSSEAENFHVWGRCVNVLMKFLKHYEKKGIMFYINDPLFWETSNPKEIFDLALGVDSTLRRFDIALIVHKITPVQEGTSAEQLCGEVKDILAQIVKIYQRILFEHPILSVDDADWDVRINRIHEEVNTLLKAHKIGNDVDIDAWRQSQHPDVLNAKASAHSRFHIKAKLFSTWSQSNDNEWEWDDD